MGRRQKLSDGDEYDVVTRWRRLLCWCKRPGATKRVKRKMNRRARQEAKAALSEERT